MKESSGHSFDEECSLTFKEIFHSFLYILYGSRRNIAWCLQSIVVRC